VQLIKKGKIHGSPSGQTPQGEILNEQIPKAFPLKYLKTQQKDS
jgi:hypothetical protein